MKEGEIFTDYLTARMYLPLGLRYLRMSRQFLQLSSNQGVTDSATEKVSHIEAVRSHETLNHYRYLSVVVYSL
jgi:hypothetical protein